MQPAPIALTAERAARKQSRSANWRECTRGLAARRGFRLDRVNKLTLLKRHGGLAHYKFVAAQSGLDVDRGAQVPAERHVLKVQFVSRTDDRHPGSLRVENNRSGRNPPAGPGGADL